jgi:hypothetical protein
MYRFGWLKSPKHQKTIRALIFGKIQRSEEKLVKEKLVKEKVAGGMTS